MVKVCIAWDERYPDVCVSEGPKYFRSQTEAEITEELWADWLKTSEAYERWLDAWEVIEREALTKK